MVTATSATPSWLGVLALWLAVVMATASADLLLPGSPSNSVSSCTKNMACRWAVCHYSDRSPLYLLQPSAHNCLLIDNRSCVCAPGTTCQVSNIMEPGVSAIKFEYRCRVPIAGDDAPAAQPWEYINRLDKRSADGRSRQQ